MNDEEYLGRSTDHKKKWSAREYMAAKYGPEAFDSEGHIKLAYIDYAIYRAEKEHRLTLKRKLERTRTLRTAQIRKQVRKADEEDHEAYVKAHESHSRDGKVEEVRGHEMHLPSYEGGASTKALGKEQARNGGAVA